MHKQISEQTTIVVNGGNEPTKCGFGTPHKQPVKAQTTPAKPEQTQSMKINEDDSSLFDKSTHLR